MGVSLQSRLMQEDAFEKFMEASGTALKELEHNHTTRRTELSLSDLQLIQDTMVSVSYLQNLIRSGQCRIARIVESDNTVKDLSRAVLTDTIQEVIYEYHRLVKPDITYRHTDAQMQQVLTPLLSIRAIADLYTLVEDAIYYVMVQFDPNAYGRETIWQMMARWIKRTQDDHLLSPTTKTVNQA